MVSCLLITGPKLHLLAFPSLEARTNAVEGDAEVIVKVARLRDNEDEQTWLVVPTWIICSCRSFADIWGSGSGGSILKASNFEAYPGPTGVTIFGHRPSLTIPIQRKRAAHQLYLNGGKVRVLPRFGIPITALNWETSMWWFDSRLTWLHAGILSWSHLKSVPRKWDFWHAVVLKN